MPGVRNHGILRRLQKGRTFEGLPRGMERMVALPLWVIGCTQLGEYRGGGKHTTGVTCLHDLFGRTKFVRVFL